MKSESTNQDLSDALHKLKNMSEIDKLRLVNRYLAKECRYLRQQLEWKQKANFSNWWNKVKDIPIM